MTIALGSGSGDFAPKNLSELIRLSEIMARTTMVPKDFVGNPGNIVVAVMAGSDVGLTPFQALQSFAVIKGRAVMWGDAVLGIVRKSGVLEYIDERFEGDPAKDEYAAVCTVKRTDEPEPRVQRFSVLDAKKAGLWKKEGPWETYPERMLKMRARSWALRDTFGDVLKGIGVREEVQDIPDERNVTPPGEAKPETTRADQVREHLRKMTAPFTVNIDDAQTAEVEVEAPLPDVSEMLAQEIGDAIDAEAAAKGLPQKAYLEIIAQNGGKRVRSNALAIIKDIRAWVAPEAVSCDHTDAPTTVVEGRVLCQGCGTDIGAAPPPEAAPATQPTLLERVCRKCGGNGFESGDPCGMCSGTGKV